MKLHEIALCLGLLCLAAASAAENQPPTIHVITVTGAISPGSADFIATEIKTASRQKAACLIIELDTPGGLAESMRDIVMAILASKIPVVVYVSPSGARAASAGVMITMAADIAAMAPGTNIGAAHPVGAGGEKVDEVMTDKIVNDMVSRARSVAEKRGRNAAWVEKAIRESVSATETEALKEKVVDLIAVDMEDLIRKINGRKVQGKGELKLDGATRKVIKESLRTKILKTISDPNIAYILMMIGLAGLYFELSHPGAIFPGVVGGIAVILAFFAFQTLPISYAGVLLILLAIIFFILEMKVASYGLLSIAGVICFLLGSLMLFDSESPDMRVSPMVLLPTVICVSGFFIVVAGLVFKTQISRPMTGEAGLIGETGLVKQSLAPEGKVFVHGEIWNATAKTPIQAGRRVRVVKVHNLVLEVEPAEQPGKAV
jgi:membrane-bound serine protease (ClpP class)